jgi:hypothetical protein
MKEIGQVRELVRYPVKSMAGIPADSAFLGWHGLDGDRRFAFRRLGDETGFPWLSASRLPELLLYQPFGLDQSGAEPLPTHVRTPAGAELALRGAELQSEIAGRFGSALELMKLKHGIFDDAGVGHHLTTLPGWSRGGLDLDRRRFRANILLETPGLEPFSDAWVGGRSCSATAAKTTGPAVSVTQRDLRCVMVN